ncbi:RDD family protein [Actinoplanes sp. NPDC049599]|uniref:RDD family protein n=1 Tax=Actinoplanes sp. NPDC049599 TaxID=3363903 RepID=UPI00378EF124
MTQADDDAAAVAGPPTGGPVRAPVPPHPAQQALVPPQTFGPPRPASYGPGPGQPPYYPPQQYGWRPQPVPVAPDGRPLADFATRLLSHLIDTSILTGIAMVVFVPVVFAVFLNLMPDFAESAGNSDPTVLANDIFADLFVPLLLVELGLFVVVLAGYYVYFVEMMFRSGQTLGKKLMKIRVVPFAPGATLTRGMAAKRYLIEFPVGIFVPFFNYLDGLWQLWDKPYQQTLHDKVAKTVVIKVAP